MSGGRFDYLDSRLQSEIFGWDSKPKNVFEDKEISELTWDLLNLIHDFDWYASGDTERKTYLESKKKFKQKWLSAHDVRVKDIIDQSISELKAELYDTYGITN